MTVGETVDNAKAIGLEIAHFAFHFALEFHKNLTQVVGQVVS